MARRLVFLTGIVVSTGLLVAQFPLGGLAAPPLPLAAPTPGASVTSSAPSTTTPNAPRTWQSMGARIDDLLAKRWRDEGVKPAAPASDGEFLRRASLDLNGIIPAVHEVREFLADSRPDKRAKLIERLLAKPTHATHLANHWRKVMLPSDANVLQFGGDAGFYGWLRGQFADNVPYDKLVTELLVSSGNAQTPGPALFYTTLQLKPEELAASTSKIFLGVQIQCAQCHNHPFDHWTRNDFWGYAAFFAQLQRPPAQQQFVFQVADADTGEVKIPETNKVVPPKFLEGAESPDSGNQKRRVRLAVWLTSGENPYFAKAAVNRLWAMMFGRGIVNPVDDMGDHNGPSHPELLDELARYFVTTNFDVRNLLRTLAATKAYQLSSESTPAEAARPELFARLAIKTLTPDQLYDCLTEAMRKRETVNQFGGQAVGFRGFDQNRQSFLAKFGVSSQAAAEYEAGIPQALTLMNGRLVRDATDIANSDILGAMDAPFFVSEADRVETLFLSTLSRLPTADERTKFVTYAERRANEGQRRKGLSDVLWALLNSAEFALNHYGEAVVLKNYAWIVATVLLGFVSQAVVAADDPADASAKEVVQQFVKAIKTKDAKETKLAEVMKRVAVPWLDIHDDRTIKDEAELKKSLGAMLDRLDPTRVLSESIDVTAYAKFREKPPDEAACKALDEVLDKSKDDRIVIISGDDGQGGRFILVQVRDGKAKIAGGPYGMAYLHHSRIPKSARLTLEKADRLELYSLDPARQEEKPVDAFHGWKVLGKTVVQDKEKDAAKLKLVDTFKQGVADSDSAAAGCFNPRHGIRVTLDGRTVDFVICFECYSAAVYVGDAKEDGFLIADSPQDAFNKVLRDAKVPLPKKRED